MASFNIAKRSNNFLRKHRRSPFSPFKTKWHQTFTQDEALRILKQSAISPEPPISDEPYLLSALVTSFKSYRCDPTPNAYYFVLKTLARTSQFHHIPIVLDRLERVEKFETPEYIFVDLIKVYQRFNRVQDAITLFRRIPSFRCVPSTLSLNPLLFLLCRNGEGLRIVPDVITYNILLESLCKNGKLDDARKLRSEMQLKGLAENLRTFRIMINGLFNNGDVTEACVVLEEMLGSRFPPQISIFGEILSCLCKRDMVGKALELLTLMVGKNFSPGPKAWEILLLSSGNELTSVKSIETTLGDLTGI